MAEALGERKTHRKKRRRPKRVTTVLLDLGERRLLTGALEAADEYGERAERSADRKKDGAARDLAFNVTRSSERFVISVAKIPADAYRSRPFRRVAKTLRKIATELLSW